MKKYILIVILIHVSFCTFAQNDPIYTKFMFNKLAYNPAYAGSREVLSLSGLYRNQWTGVDCAPKTTYVSAHFPFFQNRNGAGISVLNDQVGFINVTAVDAMYAYRIRISEDAILSLGLQGRMEHGRYDWTKARPLDVVDDQIPLVANAKTSPNFGAGIFYQHAKYYIGVSMPRFLKTVNYYGNLTNQTAKISNLRTTYIMGGLRTRLNENVYFEPAAMLSINPNAPVGLDINANFLLMNTLWVGASYRINDSFDGLIAYQLNKQLRAGIAVDFTTSKLRKNTFGSWEVGLEYVFDFEECGVKNIRFF
jgi:type IX secretion system PorP/SprF family membrane protein